MALDDAKTYTLTLAVDDGPLNAKGQPARRVLQLRGVAAAAVAAAGDAYLKKKRAQILHDAGADCIDGADVVWATTTPPRSDLPVPGPATDAQDNPTPKA